MADDEGAAYWEGVYGQPIHNYPIPDRSGDTYEGDSYTDPQVLDPDEYAAYVRKKMWEKSHQHILEERDRRRDRREAEEKRRAAARQEGQRLRQEFSPHWDKRWSDSRQSRNSFADAVNSGLKRAEARRADREWKSAWKRYSARWEALLDGSQEVQQVADSEKAKRAVQLPWPVLSGKFDDIDVRSVRAFFQNMPCQEQNATRTQLKIERVRWHPDKVTQRFQVDETTLQMVTAIFQIIDSMWGEEKDKG